MGQGRHACEDAPRVLRKVEPELDDTTAQVKQRALARLRAFWYEPCQDALVVPLTWYPFCCSPPQRGIRALPVYHYPREIVGADEILDRTDVMCQFLGKR
jgi:hypothetical protein